MSLTKQIGKHFHDVFFGGNWTSSNLKTVMTDVTWTEASTQVSSFNTIVKLVYHIHYYVDAVTKVLEGGTLDAHDKFSFDHPAIDSEETWQEFLSKVFTSAEKFAGLIERLPDDILRQTFEQDKYGNYFRNLHGIIEHTHYHLGQIVILKKLIRERSS